MKSAVALPALLLLVSGGCGRADVADSVQRLEIALWPDGPPTGNGLTGPERDGDCLTDVFEATLTLCLPDGAQAVGAFVVCPGGGYRAVCIEREGWETAEWLVERGFAAAVLKYRLPNGHTRVPADDLLQALRTVRERAGEWGIDPARIGVWGFSAGGHLAATAATGAGREASSVAATTPRPDLAVLIYPVLSMQDGITHAGSRRELLGASPEPGAVERYSLELGAGPDCPPTFLIHCRDDAAVPIANAERFRDRLAAQGVPVELLAFERGGHGPGALDANPGWSSALENWLAQRGWR